MGSVRHIDKGGGTFFATSHSMRHLVPLGCVFILFTCLLVSPPTAYAVPGAAVVFCQQYPDAPACGSGTSECSVCHENTWPPSWNAYGIEVIGAKQGQDFLSELPGILSLIEKFDSDSDGVPNGAEIEIGTGPGDDAERWPYCAPPSMSSSLPVAAGYDFRRAFRRVKVLYCGASPTYEELAAFDAGEPSQDLLYDRLHEALDGCLASTFWREQGLPRLADPAVRPVGAVGIDSPVGIPLADYRHDYRLWTYVLTGGRDARDLLLARYHVERAPDGSLRPVEGVIPAPPGITLFGEPYPGVGGQPLPPEHRAGMITTQWFHVINTMFSPLPRTTAAQAMRSYLGLDLGRQQGIRPVTGEPSDVDHKGVKKPACAICHSTVDPLAYAFAYYGGIEGPRSGMYVPSRPAELMPDWNNNQTHIFGKAVSSVREWAEVAANSNAFARNLAMTFFRHAHEREPTAGEQPEVDAAWAAIKTQGYSANALIHQLVDGRAFGGVQ